MNQITSIITMGALLLCMMATAQNRPVNPEAKQFRYSTTIDTDAAGTVLESLTWDQGINVSLGIGYEFIF